ncbi:hypothetical protein CASFOL_005392 [Castilleja foliolosa]|uniref:Bifunctional inhibitor/plant lipid transfer protein/seed storage helical domain-containing protein n=1 Tax=Castilleja foliolosa TaxID=1961234 RepID=A0ABD3E4D5_9LAMI
MNHAIHLLLLILLLHRLSIASAAANPPVVSPSMNCSDKLVAFSTCLPYVAVAPNNLSDSPPPQCCNEVSAAFSDGSAICLCYIVLRPAILGFPLNSTKVLSLTSVCPFKDLTAQANCSLRKLCSKTAALPPLRSITGPKNPTLPNFGSAASPPLHSITGPRNSTLPNFGAQNSPPPPPPLTGSAQESSDNSSTEKSPADESPSLPSLSTIPIPPTSVSSAVTQMMHRLSWTWLCFPVYIFTVS